MSEAERAEWLTARRAGIGGTDIAAILNMSPYAGPLDVWMDKKGVSTPKIETPEMRWGKKLETAIRERYEEETGWAVTQPGLQTHTLHPIMIGTPDGIVDDGLGGRVLEIKTSRWSQGWGDPGTDLIPPHYLMQCSHYMAVCDLDRCDVAALIGGSDFRVYHLRRDFEIESYLTETATAWWQRHIIEDRPPGIDGSDGAKKYLEYKYPRNTAPLKTATDDLNILLAELEAARCGSVAAELVKNAIENRIKDFIGDADVVEGIIAGATWKLTKDGVKTDWESVGKSLLGLISITEAERLVKKHTVPKPGLRRFLFTIKE